MTPGPIEIFHLEASPVTDDALGPAGSLIGSTEASSASAALNHPAHSVNIAMRKTTEHIIRILKDSGYG
jgi:hypothetical protein